MTEYTHTHSHRQIYLLGELNIHHDKGIWILDIVDQSYHECKIQKIVFSGLPGGSDGKESAGNTGDPGSIPVLGRSPGEGHGNPL